ncbi:MAG: phosphotransferase [Methylococcales bacterium]|nr:phosphotransferase [Methylococcales bacterium]
MKKNILAHRPQQLNRLWAQSIVNHHAPQAKVTDIAIQSINIGTTTRLRVQVDHSATDILPANWFVKIPSRHLKSRMITALPRLLHKEISFYNSLSGTTPLRLPPVLAAQSRFGFGSTLVMSDLSELGFTPGQPSDALSLEQAIQVIEQLAEFHAHFWNRSDLFAAHDWLGGFNASAENHLGSLLAVPLMKRGLSLTGTLIPAQLHTPALRYAANRRRIMKFLAGGVQTLVHHDCHPGNFFWNGAVPGFLDWQLIRTGEGIGDIAYFLANSLAPETRRAHEKQLLTLYLATLDNRGIRELDEQYLYHRYRAHLTYALEAMVITLAIGDMMDLTSNLELIRRTAQAVADHDSFAAVGV